MAVDQRLSVPTHRYVSGSGKRSIGRGIPHHPIQDRAWVGRMDWPRVHAGHTIAIKLFTGKTHRFHFYDLGRRIWLHWWYFAFGDLPFDYCVLYHVCAAAQGPIFVFVDDWDHHDVLFVFCREYVDGDGHGTCRRRAAALGQLWRIGDVGLARGFWPDTVGTCPQTKRRI